MNENNPFLSGLTPRCEHIFPHRCCFQPVRRFRQQCLSVRETGRKPGETARYRVTFAKEVMGLQFPVASVEVRYARNPERARQAAELRFSRRFGLDWRMRANVEEVEAV